MKAIVSKVSCIFFASLFLHAPVSSLGGEKEPDAKELLSENAGKKLKSRAILHTSAGARLIPDATPCPGSGGPSDFDEEVIVVETAPMIRVIVSQWYWRLLLFVPKDSLSDVIVTAARGTSAPQKEDTKDDTGFFELFPGRAVEILKQSQDGSDALVRIEEGYLTLTGWISRDSLGKVFVPSEKEPAELPAKSRVSLKDGASILDGVGGAVIGRYQEEESDIMGVYRHGLQSIYKIGKAKKGYQLVEIRGNRYRARGFVKKGMLGSYHEGSLSGILAALGMGKGKPKPTMTVAAGTYLHEGPGMGVVALVTQKHTWLCDPASVSTGWTGLHCDLGECTLDLWVPPK